MFGDVFNWWTVVVVESVALALHSCFVGEDTTISCKTGVGHVDVAIELNYFFDSFSLLEFGDCFFLDRRRCTSTARITDPLVTNPTAQSPFLTASMAY